MHAKTLFILFYFPPFARVGGRRWAKHIKYFQRFGEDFQVLAGDYESTSHWDKDIESYKGKISRIPVSVYYPYYKKKLPSTLLQKIMWKISYSYNHFLQAKYPGNFWDDSRGYESAFYNKAAQIIEKENIKHVCLSVGPFAYASLLPDLKRKFAGLKITLDYRDYWHDGLDTLPPEKRAYELNKQKEVVSVVDIVTAPNAEMCRYFKTTFHKKVYLLPHSIDEDFQNLVETSVKPDNDRFILLYGGTLYSKMDKYIIRIIDLIKELQKKFETVEFKILTMQPAYMDLFHRAGIYPKVEAHLPTPEFISVAQCADVILLFRPEWSPNGFSTKFFEALALRKPILYIGPDGEVNSFITQHKLGYNLSGQSAKEMAEVLFENKFSGLIPDKTYSLQQNTFEYQTKELINYWDTEYGFKN